MKMRIACSSMSYTLFDFKVSRDIFVLIVTWLKRTRGPVEF